ncbi:hypothetical protein WNB94_06000 [Aquabacterium sp. A3]|uniref:hypothetical protein n=1 Tax=Aquabacterium sp. A3 TaxID=3132829 RepID=UPI003119E1DD
MPQWSAYLQAMVSQPDAWLNHAQAYGQLASAEGRLWWRSVRRRGLLMLISLSLASLGLGLAAMAFMAWVVVGDQLSALQCAGLVLPSALFLSASGLSLWGWHRTPVHPAWDTLHEQWHADATWLLGRPESNR